MGHYKVLNHILNVIIIAITCYYTPNYNFLLKMITLDSLFSAVYFLRIYLNLNIEETEIMDHSSALYNSSASDRYIYYFLQFGVYNLLKMVFWIQKLNVIYYAMIGCLLPPVLNLILNSRMFDIIREKKEKIVKILIAKQFANGITFISKAFLNKDINLKHKEFLPLLDNYKETTNYLIEVVKNTVIVLIVFYMRTCSPGLYYRMTKYFVGYKTGDVLRSFSDDSARRVVSKVIDNRKWDEFLKPGIYNALFYLYLTNNEKTSFINELIARVNKQMAKMFCIWTLSSFAHEILIAPALSLFMIAYRGNLRFYNDRETILKIITLVIGSTIGWYSDSYFLMSFLCQFAYMLMINNLSFGILKFIAKKIRKNFRKINMINGKYILPMTFATVNSIIFGRIINIYNFPLFLMQICYVMLENYDYNKLCMICYVLCIGYFSTYHPIHIILNSLLVYYLTAVIDINTVFYHLSTCKKELKISKIKDFLIKDSICEKYIKVEETNGLLESVSEEVFELDRDDFIDAISVNNNLDDLENSFCYVETNKKVKLFDITKLPSFVLVENFY